MKYKSPKTLIKDFEKKYLYVEAHGQFCHSRYHKRMSACNCGLKKAWKEIKNILEKE
jgi:hypothetical protein